MLEEGLNREVDLSSSAKDADDNSLLLEAGTVYLLLQQHIPISRTLRVQWLLNNINKIISVPSKSYTKEVLCSDNVEIISIIPLDPYAGHSNYYQVTIRTKVVFLAQSYRFVYCLDMSPSQSSVDIQRGEILFDDVIKCFKKTLDGLCRPFTVPRNSLVWSPTIYLTVIAHTPFFMTPAQQVLVKGVQISLQNIEDVFYSVKYQLRLLVQKLVHVSAMAHDEMDLQKIENEKIVGALFEEQLENEPKPPNIPMVSADVNFVNMLRYSMLALSLLPENSLSHILVITDGVVAMPDVNIMESFMLQQHYDSTAVSFLKVGSSFHPHTSAGYVSYVDLLHFLARATKGCCMGQFPDVTQDTDMSMNVYHEAFLLWSFHSSSKQSNLFHFLSRSSEWLSTNIDFYGQKVPNLLLKKQTEDKINVNPNILLARRMREGYTVDKIRFIGNMICIELSLQWKMHIYIQYYLKMNWPSTQNTVHFEVYITAPYEFLHDITCLVKKEHKSIYRQSVIERFWIRLTQLSTGDIQIAQHLSSFNNSNIWYTVPESIRNGIPMFILNNNDHSKINITASDVSYPKFVSCWQTICQMETNNWRKWFHTHKLSLILKHDYPLPRHLHLSNSSGRFQVVQCRQAATALYGMLSDWASFIFIDNHSYLKFLYKDCDKPASWYCIVRLTSKLPCVVLNIGFSTETPGIIRHRVCEELKLELSQLLYLSTPLKSKENTCCVLLHKPLEKILVRYERMPNDFSTVVFPDGTQPPNSNLCLPPSPVAGTLFTTLSRYLYHNRWVWSTTYPQNPKLGITAISRILSTLTKMRIKEGFSFAHSSAGIINMVLEVEMNQNSDKKGKCETLSCIIQYVLFPPHSSVRTDFRDIASGSEDETEGEPEIDNELQMVTEVWIEPQCGFVVPSNSLRSYMENKPYYELSDAIRQVDMRCINTLLTLEHLSLMCQYKDTLEASLDQTMLRKRFSTGENNSKNFTRRDSKCSILGCYASPEQEHNSKRIEFAPFVDERIFHIPFSFNPIDILPICSQTELLFSMFYESSIKTMKTVEKEHSNKILLESFQDHVLKLHDKELSLKVEDSLEFNLLLNTRFNDSNIHNCPMHKKHVYSENEIENKYLYSKIDSKYIPLWRCFIKGISVTHVILTFVPSTLYDLKCLVQHDSSTKQNSNSQSPEPVPSLQLIRLMQNTSYNETPTPSNSPLIDNDREHTSSRNTNYSEFEYTGHNPNSLILPVYVYNCPLAGLMQSYTNPSNENLKQDLYEDHRYKNEPFVHEDVVFLKQAESQSRSPEPQSEDSEGSDHKSYIKLHCKSLVLAHSKCFVISLFKTLQENKFVHNVDVQYAVDQCEETVVDIDITDYMHTVCGHLKNNEQLTLSINNPTPCQDLKQFHRLIKEKFSLITNVAFVQIPSNREFYYCSKNFAPRKSIGLDQDSDDNLSTPLSEDVEFRESQPCLIHMLANAATDFLEETVNPLFLHLTCSLKYNENVINTPVNVLPTCLGEILQHENLLPETFDKTKLSQITLDILCLTLPFDVQNVINEFSTKGLRVTSFCSSSPYQPGSISSESNSFEVQEFTGSGRLNHLPEIQRLAICNLEEEIKWLLNDEIATSLLDVIPITGETVNFVIKHVSKSVKHSSCFMDIVDLNFVYGPKQSHEKFLQDFREISIPNYKLYSDGDLFYLAKDQSMVKQFLPSNLDLENYTLDILSTEKTSLPSPSEEYGCNAENVEICSENSSQKSDISSLVGSILETEGGYEEDMSEDEDGFEWLIQMENKRKILPNFWLIMKVDQDAVTVYFHCRFLEIPSTLVNGYLKVQTSVINAIRNLCKRVNQSLLLQALHDTRICDRLLEPDDEVLDIWHSDNNTPTITRNTSFARLKSMEEFEGNDTHSTALLEASLKFMPGYFSCPVVWEFHFLLHSRLKTGSGKSCLSRGIVALKTVLNKLSVSNRSNMFVYQDSSRNVFYLRLHENLHSCTKLTPKSEFDPQIVSRSPSITSLPLGQHRTSASQSEIYSAGSVSSGSQTEIRPRVQSFGEKETKDISVEDTITLKVHGITEAGPDIKCELMQVLQNRLDDAVLESLSIMLARNSMCKLTPEDVHFLQKPFKSPEITILLTIQHHAQIYMDSFQYYLRQNLLQFLNIPKYTDSRTHFHFKDYSESDQNTLNSKTAEDNIFIYNQSQNSGSRGIACIALNIISNKNVRDQEDTYKNYIDKENLKNFVKTDEVAEGNMPEAYLEFHIWKQGRVNLETLQNKLCLAVTQANWDMIMEYYFLQYPLCTKNSESITKCNKVQYDIDYTISENEQFIPILLNSAINFNSFVSLKSSLQKSLTRNKRGIKKIQPNKAVQCLKFNDGENSNNLNTNHEDNLDILNMDIKMDPYELGKKGVLDLNYSELLLDWFNFGVEIGAPAVKKHVVFISSKHSINVCIRELYQIISQCSVDTVIKVFTAKPLVIDGEIHETYIPHESSQIPQKCLLIGRNFFQWKASKIENKNMEFVDMLIPITKNEQKFMPTHSDIKFTPRQIFFYALVQSDKIEIYLYNWSKDAADKLLINCTNLGAWLSKRGVFLQSFTAQKLGLFHNQLLDRKDFRINNSSFELETLVKFPNTLGTNKDWSSRKFVSSFPIISSLIQISPVEIFRDTKCSKTLKVQKSRNADPIKIFLQEMQEIKKNEKRQLEDQKKLCGMWQTRTTPGTLLASEMLEILNQHGRVIHYCHTPLLFLASWRIQSAATRDHSFCFEYNYDEDIDVKIQCSNEDNIKNWHEILCSEFINEYMQYLQRLGFVPLQLQSSKRSLKNSEFKHSNGICYVQKSMLGGILIFTIQLIEPFFTTKLHAIECNRLPSKSRALVNQFTLSFLDECDKIKIHMHLHSFTYDFHLRLIHNYIANKPGVPIIAKYHLTHFLDDFMKYYSKAPNFARNLVYKDTITIEGLSTEAKQLYNYLLSNVKQYNMDVFEMKEESYYNKTEYVLVQVSNMPQVSYKDSQDRQHTDDFNVTLIISHLFHPYDSFKNNINLKYYLILTSQHKILPKTDNERKLGKFRTVYSIGRSLSQFNQEKLSVITNVAVAQSTNFEEVMQENDNNIITTENQEDGVLSKEESESSAKLDQLECDADEKSIILKANTYSLGEIRQEPINYLGYYSSHEQLMQQLILDQAKSTQIQIKEIVKKAMVHCRTSVLWNKLESQQNPLTFDEFVELRKFAKLENFSDIKHNIPALLNQSFMWYQGLWKVLAAKYNDQHRIFQAVDGSVQHLVILHPRYKKAFMMLSIDSHLSKGDLFAVYRLPQELQISDECLLDRKDLMNSFMNNVCFYLWSEMIISQNKF